MSCNHQLEDVGFAVTKEGLCPIYQAEEIKRLKEACNYAIGEFGLDDINHKNHKYPIVGCRICRIKEIMEEGI